MALSPAIQELITKSQHAYADYAEPEEVRLTGEELSQLSAEERAEIEEEYQLFLKERNERRKDASQ